MRFWQTDMIQESKHLYNQRVPNLDTFTPADPTKMRWSNLGKRKLEDLTYWKLWHFRLLNHQKIHHAVRLGKGLILHESATQFAPQVDILPQDAVRIFLDMGSENRAP